MSPRHYPNRFRTQRIAARSVARNMTYGPRGYNTRGTRSTYTSPAKPQSPSGHTAYDTYTRGIYPRPVRPRSPRVFWPWFIASTIVVAGAYPAAWIGAWVANL